MMSRDEFIERAKKIHQGENLDYSQVVYVNNRTPVKIIDNDLDENGKPYGEFWQTPSNHLKGQSHPKKRAKRISAAKRSSQDEIIERFKEVHKGENLDYSEVKYVNMHTKVKIISHDLRPDGTEYGEFWQEPVVHLKGCTHPDIGRAKQGQSTAYTTEVFIDKAKKVHEGEDYCYDLVDYKHSQEKVCIICNKKGHGKFYVSPDAFLQGKGCPKCGNQLSRAEDEICDFILSKNPDEEIVRRDTTILNGRELDIYLPNHNLAIEYNGLRWHCEKYGKEKYYHLSKTEDCEAKGVRLIQIFEDEYINTKRLVLSKIANVLGFRENLPRVYARKCKFKKLTDKKAVREFLERNHIQGQAGYSFAIGAFYNGVLIGVMTFVEEGEGLWNLNRFCTNVDYICVGVASKLFSEFVKMKNPLQVKSFLDRRWGYADKNVYEKMGFKKDLVLKPDYRYTNGHGQRYHKFGFRKKILHRKYGLPLIMTEAQMTESLGFYKIWDCGLIRYLWKRKVEE